MLRPVNNLVNPLLTDLYQITMAYAYWKSGRYNDRAVFELFFRKNPFQGEFTIFAGLEEALNYVASFSFTESDIDYLKKLLPHCEQQFFDWLKTLDCSEIKITAVPEGKVVFPRIPLIRVEGPLAIAQLLETTLLNLVNFASLIATNAARFRLAAGPDKTLFEFGLRRAQGPDGGISASRYAYIGGFDGTSNVLAGKLFGIPVKGTHAHSYVSSYTSIDDLHEGPENIGLKIKRRALLERSRLGFNGTNLGELAAFVAYAQAFPDGFLALVDTYDALESGIPNFICVARALYEHGFTPRGIRLDSGDLAYLSNEARKMFGQYLSGMKLNIVASNDINEPILHSLNLQGHEIDTFGIGTHLVTCQAQPALGCVYKLVEINGQPRIKVSQDPPKTTIPGTKAAYRLTRKNKDGSRYCVIDLIQLEGEQPPTKDEKILCRHPFDQKKKAIIAPDGVFGLSYEVWNGSLVCPHPTLEEIRSTVAASLAGMRPDHLRALNPTPYKVAVSQALYDQLNDLMEKEAPIKEL